MMRCIGTLWVIMLVGTAALAQDDFVVIGNGGGFAGTVTQFKITSSGKVYKGKGVGEIQYTEQGKIKKSKARKFVRRTRELLSSANSFNHPGNLYSFLSWSKDATEHRITWGDSGNPVPENIKKLYDELQSAVSSVQFKANP